MSPPTPLCPGSQTVSIAAAASAASAALPPASRARTAARVASGWLVATIASAAIAGSRGQPLVRCAGEKRRSTRGFCQRGATKPP